MKRKELKNLAKKIAQAEINRSNAKNEEERASAERIIFGLTSRIHNMTDMLMIDDYIQEEIAKLQQDKNS
jgi:hypothetical protein